MGLRTSDTSQSILPLLLLGVPPTQHVIHRRIFWHSPSSIIGKQFVDGDRQRDPGAAFEIKVALAVLGNEGRLFDNFAIVSHVFAMASVHSTRSQNRIKPDDMQPAIPAPIDLFLPVTLYIPPAPVSHAEEVPTDFPTSTEYSVAMSRIDASQSYLTPSMAATLKALLSVVHTHLSPLNTHSLVQLVASPSTTDAKLVELATTIDAGLKAFLARRGPTASASAAGVSLAVDLPVVNTQDQPITPTGGPSSKRFTSRLIHTLPTRLPRLRPT